MKLKIILIALFLIFMIQVSVIAQEKSPLVQLDELSNEALQMVKFQRYDDAKRLLDHFSLQFEHYGKVQSYSLDEKRIIIISHDEALEAVASPAIAHAEKMNRLTKFRLVMDAISSSEQPLWTEMEDPIMSTFGAIKKAASEENHQLFNESFNSFLGIYEMIAPSMRIDLPSEKIAQLDSRIQYIEESRQTIAHPTNQQEIAELETNLQRIFNDMKEDEADPSLWWVIISTGSIIIMTLSYVGFRKYKGDKEMERNRAREFKD